MNPTSTADAGDDRLIVVDEKTLSDGTATFSSSQAGAHEVQLSVIDALGGGEPDGGQWYRRDWVVDRAAQAELYGLLSDVEASLANLWPA